MRRLVRPFIFLILYGGLALGGLPWLQERLPPSRQATSPEPLTTQGTVMAESNHGEKDTPSVPSTFSVQSTFLDENGRPKLDPASLLRFIEETMHLQDRVDEYHQRLERQIQSATL